MFHRHKWLSIAAERMEYVRYFRRGPRAGEQVGDPAPITEVLQRCECGEVHTITLEGHWTLEQINK